MKIDPTDLKIIEDVRKDGWSIVCAVPTAPEDPPAFAYTVGLGSTLGWPEIVCVGLSPDRSSALLNAVIAEIGLSGKPPEVGLSIEGVVIGGVCKLAAVSGGNVRQHLTYARWYEEVRGAEPEAMTALQLLWPDPTGNLPDNPKCESWLRGAQPLLA